MECSKELNSSNFLRASKAEVNQQKVSIVAEDVIHFDVTVSEIEGRRAKSAKRDEQLVEDGKYEALAKSRVELLSQ